MIIRKTKLTVADNSGAKKLICIGIPGSTRKRSARVGDVIKVSVREASPTSGIKKGDVKDAVVVRTCKEIKRRDGSTVKFDENSAVIINNTKDKAPVGTRIFGPVARELRALGYMKIVSLAPEVL